MTHTEQLPGGGTWWPEDGHLWAKNGQISLPNTTDRGKAQLSILRFNAGEYWCCSCKQWYEGKPAFQRFAGLYCEPCAEVYKAANSRACRMCRQPIYNCYC